MPIIRILFIICGTISLVLGVIGAFVPLLPTTPFLLLTAFLYYKSSPRCYNWLLRQPLLGKYIRDFHEHKIIPLRAKIISLTLMWGSISYTAIVFVQNWPIRILLMLVAVGVTVHILSFKSE